MQVKQVGQQEKYRGIFKVFRSCFEAPHTIFKEFFTGNWSDSEANIIYRICNYDAQVRCSRVHGQNRAKRPLFSPRHSQSLYIVVVSIWALGVPNLQSLRKATEDLLRHYDFTQVRHCIVRQRCWGTCNLPQSSERPGIYYYFYCGLWRCNVMYFPDWSI